MEETYKNSNINDILKSIDDYEPLIPESVILLYSKKAGMHSEDKLVMKLLSKATDKFLTEIILDTIAYNEIRNKGKIAVNPVYTHQNINQYQQSVKPSEIFELEDLARSVTKRNIRLKNRSINKMRMLSTLPQMK